MLREAAETEDKCCRKQLRQKDGRKRPSGQADYGMENSERHISREELFPFVHYEYGEAYYGSCGNLRYRIAREPLQNVHYTPPDKRGEAVLRAVSWQGPFGYAATDDSLKTVRDFPFTEEGMQEAADWLDSQV